jgi:hypothetical protein
MRVTIAFFDELGRINSLIQCDESVADYQTHPTLNKLLVSNEVTLDSHWIHPIQGAILRPSLEAPTLVENELTVWSGLPEGALVTVIDPATGLTVGSEVVGETNEVELQLPAGTWNLIVSEVFPTFPAFFTVNVLENQ